MKAPAVYILASQRNGTLYIGVTSDLIKRIWQHREGVVEGFTEQYEVKTLVWYEQHETMESAISREKQLKKWNRDWKLRLIEKQNPQWLDLWPEITGASLSSPDASIKPFPRSTTMASSSSTTTLSPGGTTIPSADGTARSSADGTTRSSADGTARSSADGTTRSSANALSPSSPSGFVGDPATQLDSRSTPSRGQALRGNDECEGEDK